MGLRNKWHKFATNRYKASGFVIRNFKILKTHKWNYGVVYENMVVLPCSS